MELIAGKCPAQPTTHDKKYHKFMEGGAKKLRVIWSLKPNEGSCTYVLIVLKVN